MRRIVLSAVAATLGCVPYGPGVGQSEAATVLAATALGATSVYRSKTRGCWANCQSGTQCDHDSGTCEPIPCGGCPTDTHCVPTPSGDRCVPRLREGQRARLADAASAGGPCEAEVDRGFGADGGALGTDAAAGALPRTLGDSAPPD